MYVDNTATGEWLDAGGSRARAHLQRFLQENAASLQGIICGYVAKMGLATGGNIEAVAAEVFQDAALETLAKAERFNPEMQPRPWFLAIAANVLKRHRASYARRYKFEVLVGKLAERPEQENEQDILDQIMAWGEGAPGPEQALVSRESVRELLALVTSEDARLLNMALLQGWDASALARLLGITPGAARVRIHRALSRLRAAWRTSEQRKEQDRG